jgi:signal transduction histidine kinase
MQVIEQKAVVEYPDIYTDRWGTWLSSAAPLFDEDGNVAAVIGLDVEADYVFQLQREIRNKVLIAFVATYALLFIIIYVASDVLTQYLGSLSKSSKSIARGNYVQTQPITRRRLFTDELDDLAQSFETMVESIRVREALIRRSNRAEHEVQLALQRERKLHELKSQFISLVSHEFRTPLTVIRTSTELLQHYKDVASEEKQQSYFQKIHSAVKNMSNLIDDVLTIGQTEAGKLQVHLENIKLEQFCLEVVQEIQASIHSPDRIQLISTYTCSDAHLDPKLLRSILSNLLSNAIKCSSADSPVKLTLSCSTQDAIFEVQDYGIGIPESDQPQLFELFHRGQNVSNIGGTGLGLAITKQCVDLLNGTISFSSKEKEGTRFVVTLPLHSASSQSNTQNP